MSKEYHQLYYVLHKEHIRNTVRAYQREHREYVLQYMREYNQKYYLAHKQMKLILVESLSGPLQEPKKLKKLTSVCHISTLKVPKEKKGKVAKDKPKYETQRGMFVLTFD